MQQWRATTYFTQNLTANPNPVAIAFSTGDGGYPEFPATSTSVLAVGGTGLYNATTRGKYGFETAWGNLQGDGAGGGGTSSIYAKPTFQAADGRAGSFRTIPDVAAIADPLTAVSVYNSWDTPTSPWTGVGGTSLAAPVVTGIVDLGQELRLKAGLATLTSPQINAKLYASYATPSLYAAYFHDISVGNNSNITFSKSGSAVTRYSGTNATTGYDLATGLGSPIAPAFVAYLAAP